MALPYEHEIIFVDDGSRDKTLEILKAKAREDEKVKIISFSRNFGHPLAISAGLEHASGSAGIVMDSDLQDPPEVIKKFIARWREGYNVVYGVRRGRKEWFGKKLAYWAFYRILQNLSPLKMPLDSGDFSLFDRRVLEVIKKMPERNRFVRGLRTWAGFKQTGVEFERDVRFAGKTKYPFKKLLRLAADGIFSFSYLPLKIATFFGFIIALASFVAILAVLYLRIFAGSLPITGFASTIIVVLFLGGIQLITIGLLGEYVGRIYEEVKKRPLYVIEEKIGFND